MSHEKAVYKLRQTICFPHLGPSKPNRLKNSKQNSKSENQWQSAIPLPESVLPEPLKKVDLQSLSQGQNNYNIGFHNLLSRLKLRASSSASKSKSNIVYRKKGFSSSGQCPEKRTIEIKHQFEIESVFQAERMRVRVNIPICMDVVSRLLCKLKPKTNHDITTPPSSWFVQDFLYICSPNSLRFSTSFGRSKSFGRKPTRNVGGQKGAKGPGAKDSLT